LVSCSYFVLLSLAPPSSWVRHHDASLSVGITQSGDHPQGLWLHKQVWHKSLTIFLVSSLSIQNGVLIPTISSSQETLRTCPSVSLLVPNLGEPGWLRRGRWLLGFSIPMAKSFLTHAFLLRRFSEQTC
jgi:hypothetical protein